VSERLRMEMNYFLLVSEVPVCRLFLDPPGIVD
jgi:hypothetical protein